MIIGQEVRQWQTSCPTVIYLVLEKHCVMKQYYEAYDERYKTIHAKGYSWASDERTPIVMDTIQKYQVSPSAPMLEIGCGEGRDAKYLLSQGFRLLATDVSPEAVAYCKKTCPDHENSFQLLNCLNGADENRYDFIYSVAVIHMLLLDEDRAAFYRFIRQHLSEQGLALICSMGDGETEIMSDARDAFTLQERNHPSGIVKVACTSCRMVSFPRFASELSDGGLRIIEKGITSSMPEFNALMYAVVQRG